MRRNLNSIQLSDSEHIVIQTLLYPIRTYPLLQDHQHIPHVAVYEVNNEVGSICCPHIADQDQICDSPLRLWERYPVGLGLLRRLHPLYGQTDAVMVLTVGL